MPEGGYGSHRPALKALARFTKIHSVIEFGAGFSTQMFLDRKAFPDLTSLVTFEHSQKWADGVKTGDARHKFIVVPSEEFAAASQGMHADFVFVDSGPTITHRFKLLPHALKLAPILAIHDCTARDVRGQKVECVHIKEFNRNIQTVFVSDTVDLSGLELE